MITHQFYYQTNIKKFNSLGAIFQFYIPCTIRGHLESNFNMQSKSSNFYTIYINKESIKSKSSVEVDLDLERLKHPRSRALCDIS